MSVHRLNTRTAAEMALIERAHAAIDTAGHGDERRAALEKLRAEGLPHRRIEAWHYTDLRSLMRSEPATAESSQGADASLLAPLLPNSAVVEIGAQANANLPEGVTAGPFDGLPDWRRQIVHADRDFDTIRVLNVSLGGTAGRIDVAAGTDLAAPIEIRPQAGRAGNHSYGVVTVGDGAKAIFVERVSAGPDGSLSTGVSELKIGDEADVLWIVDQQKGDGETHFGQLDLTLGRDARLRLFVLNAGGALVRQEVHVETRGEGSDIQIRGVNLLKSGQHVDVTTTLNHTVPNTTATETFRNVVTGGHGVFQGMIKVAKGAQKTDAKMACNSLLLSDDGDFSAKPELEIFADDVQCGHGATAGELDADHLFYLMSRGIPAAQARALLVRAFVDEVVEELEHEAAIEALEVVIDRWLEANG